MGGVEDDGCKATHQKSWCGRVSLYFAAKLSNQSSPLPRPSKHFRTGISKF